MSDIEAMRQMMERAGIKHDYRSGPDEEFLIVPADADGMCPYAVFTFEDGRLESITAYSS